MKLHGGLMGRNQTLFRRVLELVKDDNKFEARRLIADEINRNPGNADAWIVMAQLIDDRERAVYYFERALELRPYDEKVRNQLERIKAPAGARGAQRHPTIGTPIPAMRHVPEIELLDDSSQDDDSAHETLELIRMATGKPGAASSPAESPAVEVEEEEDDTLETEAAVQPGQKRNRSRLWLLPTITILIGLLLVAIGASGAISLTLDGSGSPTSVPVTYRVTTAGGGESVITYLDEAGQMRQSRTSDSAWSRTLTFTAGKPVSVSVQAPEGTGVNCEIVVNGAVVVSQQAAGGNPAACDGILATR
jgi:hypothetical protein